MRTIMSNVATRRAFTKLGLASMAVVTFGCAQHTAPVKPERRFTYHERIENVLVAPSKTKLVVLGERYHYVFDDARLVALLSASFRNELRASFGTFRVNPDNSIEGSYQVRARRPLTKDEIVEAVRLGFAQTVDGLQLTANIRGQRSTAVPLAEPALYPKLKTPYAVPVEVFGGPADAQDPSATRRAADAMASLFVVPVFVVLFFFFDGCLTCK
jgi:hypothetical protein